MLLSRLVGTRVQATRCLSSWNRPFSRPIRSPDSRPAWMSQMRSGGSWLTARDRHDSSSDSINNNDRWRDDQYSYRPRPSSSWNDRRRWQDDTSVDYSRRRDSNRDWRTDAARVYPQDLGVLSMTMNATDQAAFANLPSELEHFELESGGHHCWLLNTRLGVTFLLLMAKRECKITFEDIAKKIGRDEMWTTSAMFGNQTFDERTARIVIEMMGFGKSHCAKKMIDILQSPPMRVSCPVRDPTLNRVRELADLYAHPIKALIHEKLGDGVMSAVDQTVRFAVKRNRWSPWESVTGRYNWRNNRFEVDRDSSYTDNNNTNSNSNRNRNDNSNNNDESVDLDELTMSMPSTSPSSSRWSRQSSSNPNEGARICVAFEGLYTQFPSW